MYLIVDFEATCWKKDTPEGRRKTNRNENEIIEIGAAIVNDSFQMISSLGLFVKPILNPVLSDFCKQLTTITQEDIDNAEPLSKAWIKFENDVRLITDKMLSEFVFCSWGHYDRRQLKRDLDRHGLQFPFTYHVSLKHDFLDRTGKRFGVGQALQYFGLQFEGTQHRGVDDAKNIARIFAIEWKSTGFILRDDHKCATQDMLKS